MEAKEFYKKFPEVITLRGCNIWPEVLLRKKIDDARKKEIKNAIGRIKPNWHIGNIAFVIIK